MAKSKYDFSGWATRINLKCSDGRTIKDDAFKDNDGQTVPLVWNHRHDDPDNVLGHALLKNVPGEGVYAYGSFNDTERGQNAKEMVMHGDVTSLSIYANKLKQIGSDVFHGQIREVSLVLAGANPGAYIDSVLTHSDSTDENGRDIFEGSATIYTGESIILEHADSEKPAETKKEEPAKEQKGDIKKMENKGSEKTVQEVIDSMTEEQKNVMYALVGMAAEEAGAAKYSDNEEEETEMKHNLFDQEDQEREDVIAHSDVMAALADGKRFGSMKESFLEHGITNIEWLFPENKNVNGNGAPGFINTQPQGWITDVMKGVHHTPFSRIKMMFADITVDEARAKGYIKGNYKLEEQFGLLKRTVNPQTVYKKQKLDRDDVVDITDFDVVSWLKGEMRMKLDEELARAFLFGDGRSAASDDKINEANIIPILKDTTNNLYAMEKTITQASGETLGHAIINGIVKALDDYEGSGNTTLFIKQGLVSDMLLLEDTQGHRMYKGLTDLANAMSVNKIVKVPASIVPDGYYGVVVDLADYNVGADKGGAVNMFDDFDIDYNAQKYLIETRCSGALIKPHSAIVLKAAAGE